MTQITLEAFDLLVKYQERTLFQAPYLKIASQDTVYLSGRNGVGKTTLLKVLSGLQKPQMGYLNLKPPSRFSCFSRAYKRPVIYMHQTPYLFDSSVEENVAYGLKGRSFSKHARDRIILDALKKIGIAALRHQHISILSAGERQKVAMARAWALNPSILFMDESSANLDPEAIEAQKKMIHDLLDKGASLMITSHHPNALTKACNQHWIIENQGIIKKKSPSD